tara:strand:- start:890 stop:1564 length:675 start_codon:yes stop_codon:yes gene_type:complete
MKTYIAVATQQSTPNSGANNNSNEMPVIGLGGAGVVISLVSILIGKWMPWGEIAKQFAGVRTSKVLQAENRKGQELEAEIDINQGLADTVSQIAKHSADSSEFVIKDLLHLVGDAIQSSTANAHSTQALSRASESQVQATEDLIKATTHNSEALKALKEAIASIPKETASVIEVYAAEFRVALDLLDDRLDRIEKNQKLFSVQVKEEFSSAFLELRRALKAKEG